jgi:GMP synthase (glutamine-hydrolysing)
VKPFLLVATRDHDAAAAGEWESVRRHMGLEPAQLRHIRAETGPVPPIDLDDYSGIVLGGGPFNVSDAVKSPLQRRVEAELGDLVDRCLAADFPFVGLCYGVGLVTWRLGEVVDHSHAEPVGAARIELTAEGRQDPLLDGVPEEFWAFVGHKEAARDVPLGATLLAAGDVAPVQMYRVGSNVYVTQFHPELDADELATRMRIYEDAGYFAPSDMDRLIAEAHAAPVTGAQHKVLANFARRYARA